MDDILNGIVPLAGGIYGLLLAYGVVSVSKNQEKGELWLRKFGKPMKILSPLVVAFGIATMFGVFRA